MTFDNILSLFQLNPNELFKIEGQSGIYCFRPTGEDKNVKLFETVTHTEPSASIAFYLMENPEVVKKGRLFSNEEAKLAQLILDVTSDEQLYVMNTGGVYSLSNGKTISVVFPNIKNGEKFLLSYILNNTYEEGVSYYK